MERCAQHCQDVCLVGPVIKRVWAVAGQDWMWLKVDGLIYEQPRIKDALPFTTTMHHRIMVPSDDGDGTVKAIDLKVGSWVMCSDHMAKKVIGKREYLAAGLLLWGQFAL